MTQDPMNIETLERLYEDRERKAENYEALEARMRQGGLLPREAVQLEIDYTLAEIAYCAARDAYYDAMKEYTNAMKKDAS